jgi:formiminoglutamase
MPTPEMSVWTGRVDAADGPRALRWHQMVRPLAADSPPGVVLVGFACDEGVRRSGGRVGAKDGPRAIRAALANLAWHQNHPVYDAGDVRCDDGDMEGAQSRLAEVVADVIRAGHRPLVLGGGHETAWGTFQGIVGAKPDATVGVINIDAHLDLRADEPGSSGTSFYQIAKWCERNRQPFKYLCLGVSLASNTGALFERARELGADWMPDYSLQPIAFEKVVTTFCESVEFIHLSIDLDVLPAAVMPAVSAPAGRGIQTETVEGLLVFALGTRKVIAVDLVELNPHFDVGDCGLRVAGRLAWHVTTEYSREEPA